MYYYDSNSSRNALIYARSFSPQFHCPYAIRNKYCSDYVLTSIQINLGSFSQFNDVV
jgi:hypothetical protein